MTSGKLGKTYPGTKYGNNPSNIKTIRVTKEQEMNWNPDLIRSVLEGSHKSNDSIRINVLKKDIKRLYQIMNLFLLPKIDERKIAEIPNSVLEELESLEEVYNFE